MSKRKIAEIDALLDKEPKTVARSGNVVLENGKRRYTLADSKGLTALGKHYYNKSGKTFTKGYDPSLLSIAIKIESILCSEMEKNVSQGRSLMMTLV